MVRQVAPVERKPSPPKFNTSSAAATAPLTTSGLLIGSRDLGGATRAEENIKEIIERDRLRNEQGLLVDEDGNLLDLIHP